MTDMNGKTKRWKLRGLILLRFGRMTDFAHSVGIPLTKVSEIVNVRFDPNPHDKAIFEEVFCEGWETLGVAQSHSEFLDEEAERKGWIGYKKGR